jgi:uncharacterized protein YecA (UPF0149 family)
MMNEINNAIVDMLLKVELKQNSQFSMTNDQRKFSNQNIKTQKHIGRNDPCPCGKINPETGKPMKYKKCCYPKYG